MLGVLIDVQLGDAHPAGLFGCDLVEDRSDHLARTAPLGPEIDDNRCVGVSQNRVEVVAGELECVVRHEGSFVCFG